MLGLHILIGTTNPVLATLGCVTILQLVVNCVLLRRCNMVIVLVVVGLRDGYLNCLIRGLLSSLCDQLVDITCSASENLVLFGHVTGIARQVFLVVLDECLGSHFCNV